MKFFLSALALAFGAYVVVQASGVSGTATTAQAGGVKAQCPQTLREGHQNGAVTSLQRELSTRQYSLNIDGSFGRDTKQAVMSFQKRNKLESTGVVNEATWRALNKC